MRSRARRAVLISIASAAALLLGAFMYFGYAPAPQPPQLSGSVQRSTIRVGQLDRTYTFYGPARLARDAPLVMVFHGAMQSAAGIRKFTGYEFERLADANGYVVVYPEGYKGNWSDCRKAARYAARVLDIDDKAFVQALVRHFSRTVGIDTRRVFVAGFSNGGHLAYRLALELPAEIAGVAAIGASLPTADNSVCRESRQAVPVLIMNGTADPINPYDGGEVSLYGFNSRGDVRSSSETARYFARLAEYDHGPGAVVRIPDPGSSASPSVKRESWSDPGKSEVVLYSVTGGGHVVPQSSYRAPRLLGRTVSQLNGPAEIWGFFARQPPAPAAVAQGSASAPHPR